MSFFGWLDYSDAEQQQVRELLQLFADKGTVDDLGIGTIRDAISNQLFPGTSVVQTRARYFLFIPWIYERAERRHPTELVPRAEMSERRLISALQQADDKDGLIGRQAGKDVRTLPSSIFWTGLAEYGIFLRPGLTRAQYGRALRRGPTALDPEDELAERSHSYWHRSIPAPPADFFDFGHAEFRMTRDEAEWLSERVLSTEPLRGPNLLGAYVRELQVNDFVPDDVFWREPLPGDLPDRVRDLVHHGERFSHAVEGAALIYNLMLRQDRDDPAKNDPGAAEELERGFEAWADKAFGLSLPEWGDKLDEFWLLVTQRSRIPAATATFVEAWCSLIATRPLGSLAVADDARELIRQREQRHKRSQARFANPARLKSWNGDSGLQALEFRWPQVQRFLRDLAGGLHPTAMSQEVERAAN